MGSDILLIPQSMRESLRVTFLSMQVSCMKECVLERDGPRALFVTVNIYKHFLWLGTMLISL